MARQETLQAKKIRRTINALFSRLRGTRTTIPRRGSATSAEADYTARGGRGDSCRQVEKKRVKKCVISGHNGKILKQEAAHSHTARDG